MLYHHTVLFSCIIFRFLYVFGNKWTILDLVTVFAWEAYERGSDVHLQADPTKLELLHKSFKVKKEDFKEKQGDSILKKVNTLL